MELYQHPWYVSPYRKLVRQWMTPEWMTIEAQELLVSPDNKGYAELGVKPISFGHKAHQLVEEISWMYGARDKTKRETMNA